MIKTFLRELPEPLLTTALYKKWLDSIASTNQQDVNTLILHLNELINELPEVNCEVLLRLLDLWHRIHTNQSINKMNIAALSTVIGPTLLWDKDSFVSDLQAMNSVNQLAAILIDKYEHLVKKANVEAENITIGHQDILNEEKAPATWRRSPRYPDTSFTT